MNKLLNRTVVIIPSYNPPDSLPELCQELFGIGFESILIVNDGSSSETLPIFTRATEKGCIVTSLSKNEGKGSAIRRGILHVLQNMPECENMVFCDDDGQHSPLDVMEVSLMGVSISSGFVIGVRDVNQMPFKSYIGNKIMCLVLKHYHGLNIPDTQSGLRFISKDCAGLLLSLNHKRFSFELMSLIYLHNKNIEIMTCPIRTIYFNKNRATRFMPIHDSFDVVRSTLFTKKKVTRSEVPNSKK